MRAAIYTRLSVHRGDLDPSLSPQRQEATCRAYCEAKGWQAVEVFADLDQSGSSRGLGLDRPALRAIRDRWAEIDVVIFAKLDRLSRSVVDFRDFAEEAAQHGVALVSVAESLDLSTPAGRFVASILAAFAEMESDTIADRVRGGIASVRSAARYSGGNVPYGYESAPNPDGPGRVLVVREAEAAIVREAADRLLRGQTLYSIATDLNARKVPTRRGGPWSVQALLQMLPSDTVVGRLRHPGRQVPVKNADGSPRLGRTGKPVMRHVLGDLVRDEAGEPVQAWPPVLDLDVWARVRVALNVDVPKAERPAPRRRRARLLSGIARCATCGKYLYTKTDGRGKVAYSCATISRGRADLCPGNSVDADLLDAYITGLYLDSYGDQQMFERRVSAGGAHDTAEVERAIREVTAALAEADEDTEAALMRRLRDLKARRTSLRSTPAARTVTLVPTGTTHRQAWDDAAEHLDDRRALLAATFPSISVRKGTRGRRGLDTSRIVVIGQPTFAADASDPEHFTAGAPAFTVDPDDLDANDFAEADV